MAKKSTIVATFPNDDIMHRSTTLTLTHAWRVLDADGKVIAEGFSGRRELAEKAAAAVISSYSRWSKVLHVAQVVKADVVDAKEFAAKLIQAKPFRVTRVWKGNGPKTAKAITENGNKAARWTTRDEAAAFVRKHLDDPKAYYHNATLTIVDDRETKPAKTATGFRVQLQYGGKTWKFLKDKRSHRRWDTREAAQAYIDRFYQGGISRVVE